MFWFGSIFSGLMNFFVWWDGCSCCWMLSKLWEIKGSSLCFGCRNSWFSKISIWFRSLLLFGVQKPVWISPYLCSSPCILCLGCLYKCEFGRMSSKHRNYIAEFLHCRNLLRACMKTFKIGTLAPQVSLCLTMALSISNAFNGVPNVIAHWPPNFLFL